jgi:HK97 family phage major capsid protein
VNETELRDAYNAACEAVQARAGEYDALAENQETAEDVLDDAKRALADAIETADTAEQRMKDADASKRAREKYVKVPGTETEEVKSRIRVDEPDMYSAEEPSFLRDLYLSQLRNDPGASARIGKHHVYELERMPEKRAIATGTLGGIIPPQYLVDLYAKAPRNGRIFADQQNRDNLLPDVGMSLIVPRLTVGTAAAVQATENSALTTQDPTEVDLTVPVRTIGGYIPVSRQTLERASYSEGILFEDLVARYYAALDVDCLNGSGASGHMLGLLQTSGVVTSVAGVATLTSIWPKIADVIQQINSNVGGLGYMADKIFMHPRRWGFFEAALDTAGRPVFGINGLPNYAPNAAGEAAGYGPVGRIHGLPVYTDANIPTNFHTDEDPIIVSATRIVHLWERSEDPVTLSFEQQAGTSLQVQLIAYGYAAFTAGRYPAASGYVYGAGLVAPTFGS